MALLKSNLKKEKVFNDRIVYHKKLLSELHSKAEIISHGGGKKAIEKLHSQKKLHCRERINLLIDKGSAVLEIGQFTAYGMYKDYGEKRRGP